MYLKPSGIRNALLGTVALASALSGASMATAAATSLPTAVTGPASAVVFTTATVAGNVAPDGLLTSWDFQYGTTAGYGLSTVIRNLGAQSTSVAVSAALVGLTPGTTYHYRLDARSSAGTAVGSDATFTTAEAAPVITTYPASRIGDTSAVVSGTVDPNGLASSWYVAYGATPAYGLDTMARSAGSGTAQVHVATVIGGLSPNLGYHFEIVSTNAAGSRPGGDRSFTTTGPPRSFTGPPEGVATTSATLTGSVDPDGHATIWQFEYGLTTAYGSHTVPLDAGSGTVGVAVSRRVTGLVPGTTYHFRLVATNSAGTSPGGDAGLTTPGPTLAVSSSAVVFGRQVTLSGTVPDYGANETVAVFAEATPSASFVSVGTVLTGTGGVWSLGSSPVIETSYKVLWDGEVSPVVSVGVEPSVSLRAGPDGAFVTRVLADHGYARRTVRLQRRVHGTWRTVASRRLNGLSKATFHPVLSAGISRLRVYLTSFQAGPGYLAGYSAMRSFRRK